MGRGITHWKNQPLAIVATQTKFIKLSIAIILRSLLFPDYEPPTAAVPNQITWIATKERTQFWAIIYGMYALKKNREREMGHCANPFPQCAEG